MKRGLLFCKARRRVSLRGKENTPYYLDAPPHIMLIQHLAPAELDVRWKRWRRSQRILTIKLVFFSRQPAEYPFVQRWHIIILFASDNFVLYITPEPQHFYAALNTHIATNYHIETKELSIYPSMLFARSSPEAPTTALVRRL